VTRVLRWVTRYTVQGAIACGLWAVLSLIAYVVLGIPTTVDGDPTPLMLVTLLGTLVLSAVLLGRFHWLTRQLDRIDH